MKMICRIIWRRGAGLAILALTALAACGGELDAADGLLRVRDDRTDLPLATLSPAWRERFDAGDDGFEQVFRGEDGLGPVYIRNSCAACHQKGGKGAGAVTKMAIFAADGLTLLPDQAVWLPYGPTVRPAVVGDAVGVWPPAGLAGLRLSRRLGPAIFGRGWLEAIDDAAIEAEARAQAGRGDGIHGRINWVRRQSRLNPDTRFHAQAPGARVIGRLGVKARIPTLDDFTADAYQGDMGLTSPLRPDELPTPAHPAGFTARRPDLTADTVNLVADYVRLVTLPRRLPRDGRGELLFARAQCAACHVPSLPTRADYPIPQLAGKEAPVYTDMLLHDMGDALADGVQEFSAGGRDWRTAPLIGVRHLRSYLHDGRASDIDTAIRLHAGDGSEANGSVATYLSFSPAERAALRAFVEAL
jgi:CxxC motif-containing protein (DUF1111 family)